MKKYIYFLIVGIFLLLPIPVLAVVEPTDRFYINDYANILSSETEDYIFEHSRNLDSKTKAQIVIVTIESLESDSLEEYATTLFREFGIGDKDEDNGLLILLALEERQVRVEVGYGLEGILPDGKTGRFQDEYMIPFFSKNNFDEGMLNGYKAFYKELVNYYGISEDVDEPLEMEESEISSSELTIAIISIFIAIFMMIILPIMLVGRRVYSDNGNFGGHFRNSGFGSRSSFRGGFSGRGGSSGGGGSSRRF